RTMTMMEDIYPSRNGAEPGLMARVDPVVYATEPQPGLLDPAVLKSYEDNGYMLLDAVFSEAEVDEIRRELDHLRSDPALRASEQVITEPGSGDIRSIFKVHDYCP